MSKSSAVTATKIPSQLPQKSAWSKGPPQSTSTAPTSRSQSPAPNNATAPSSASHSRRPSTLGQGVSFKDGVGARSPVNTVKSGSAVTFGSIDDASAPISTSPAAAPAPIKSEGIKSFGSVAAAAPTPKAAVNGKPPVASSSSTTAATPSASSSTSSTPAPHHKMAKADIKRLFQNPSSGPSPSTSSQAPSDVSSPSTRSAPLPSHSQSSHHPHGQPGQHHQQPTQFGSHPYSTFVPGNLRPQQNGANGTPSGPPRSPSFPRQVPNGTQSAVNGRPTGAPGAPAAPMTGMSSPRMGPPMGGQPTGMPPGQPVPVAWPAPAYYYAPYPAMQEYMPYSPSWQMSGLPPQPPPQGPPGPHQGMPMSPRNPPSTLHAPGTPTLTPAVPSPGHPPHSTPSPHTHTSSLSNVTSPPATPSSAIGPGSANRPGRLDRDASIFVPRKNVTIKTTSGEEVNLESLKRQSAHIPSSPIVTPSSPARRAPIPIRIESETDKNKRLAEEQERERQKKETEDRLKREAEEREKRRKDEEAQKKREEEEKAEKVKKEAEEKERLKKEEEEKERLRKEDEEKEKSRKEEEEKERLRKAEEEKERLRKEAEAKAQQEEEARLRKQAEEKPKEIVATPESTLEEGELEESEEVKEQLKEEAKDKVPDKASLRIDTSLSNHDGPRKRPGPLDLSGTKQPISAPLPSALASARIIEDINTIQYPSGIMSPKPELNANAKDGKFRYDRDFLLQFMSICKEKPDSLPPLDAIGLEPADQQYAMARGGSGRRSSSATMGPPSSSSNRPASMGLGISGFGGKGGAAFNMGQFATQGSKMSSEERFAISNRSASMSGAAAGLPFGRGTPMVRSSSQGGAGTPSHRTRSKRGEKRGEKTQSQFAPAPVSQPMMGLEPVAPLEVSANRWVPGSIGKKPAAPDSNSPEIVDRKVKGLLNKLTMERFDSISDQIIAWANKSETEKDGRTLIQVIRLVFEKATDEATWSEMYARLCRKMMEQISPKVQDDGIRSADGKPITGGHLFRKYLLNRCQEDFERGWVAKEATAAAAATKATEDKAAKAAAENDKDGEAALYSDEYYAAQKAKRQGLGLIKFIGELFKLQMLTERIMHECVKKLLGNVENPEEEEIESLCKLLATVGQLLDTPKARAHMDVYFSRMKELTKSANVNSRMQFMLQDVIELRERKWIPRNQVAAPTTIAAVHEAAAKEKERAEKDNYNRTLSMSRGGSRRGGERGEHQQVGPDGWSVAGSAPRPPPKAGDLSNFGKITKNTTMSFAPTNVFNKKDSSKRESIRASNMFSALSQNPELAAEAAAPSSKSSRPPSRKPSIDLGAGGASEPPQRRKLQLLPRSIPKDDKADETPAASPGGSEDEIEAPSMTEAEAKKRVAEDSKEFFSIRDLGEADVYFTKLPAEHRHLLVDKLVSVALESKEADAKLVADLFAQAASKNHCSPDAFEKGFAGVAEFIDDIVVDSPKAFQLFATMMKGAGLDKDEERRGRLVSKSIDSDKLVALLS
ncbi:hypothetical protein C8Q75DRAFT_748900 [Abortiporus biennis]|nr:hypothetical protein C8Q75DRAFT_748900 [Abortiporus biennis]